MVTVYNIDPDILNLNEEPAETHFISTSVLLEMPAPVTRSHHSFFNEHKKFLTDHGYLIVSATIDDYYCNFYLLRSFVYPLVIIVNCYNKQQSQMNVVNCLNFDRLDFSNVKWLGNCPDTYKLIFVIEDIYQKLDPNTIQKVELLDSFKAPILNIQRTSYKNLIKSSLLAAILGRKDYSKFRPLDWGYNYKFDDKAKIQAAVEYFQNVKTRNLLRDLNPYNGVESQEIVKQFSDTVKISSKKVGESWYFGRFSVLCRKLKAKMMNENELLEGFLFFLKVLEEGSLMFIGNTEKHRKVLLKKYQMSKIL